MPIFKTRFNYLYFICVFLGLLFFIGVAIFFFFYGFPLIIEGEKNKVPMYIGLTAASVGLLYAIYYCGGILGGYRNILIFESDRIIVKDAIFLKTKEIEHWYIEGYTMSKYIFTANLSCIDIWLKNGDNIKLLNYMTWNFKEVKPALDKLQVRQIS